MWPSARTSNPGLRKDTRCSQQLPAMTLHPSRAHNLHQPCPMLSSQDHLHQRITAACSSLSPTSIPQNTRLITPPDVWSAVLCDFHEFYSITARSSDSHYSSQQFRLTNHWTQLSPRISLHVQRKYQVLQCTDSLYRLLNLDGNLLRRWTLLVASVGSICNTLISSCFPSQR